MEREFEIVVFGATGYTGKLVAGHLLNVYGADKELKWAIAGRDKVKLAKVRDEIGAPSSFPLVLGDVSDSASLTEMVRRTKLIATTVGPYRLYGSDVVAACAREGTDYVDITGESDWIHDMLKHESAAQASGARIVFCCGFDCIPFELGVYFLQKTAMDRFGGYVSRVRGRIRKLAAGIRGGMSGGSQATMTAAFQKIQKMPEVLPLFLNPFALTPGFIGPEQPDGSKTYEDRVTGSWVEPFMMAGINTKIVHRSNFLMGHLWSQEFRYDEMTMIGGPSTPDASQPNPLANMRKPGEGPTKADREGGCYELLYIGEAADGRTARINVKSIYDASADSTSRLMGESAVCLVRDISRDKTPGGIWTCSSAMGDALIKRVESNAGLTFQIED